MSYLPFARKYRPQTFEDLVGQPHVATTLSRALEAKRVAQAYLFTGQRGVGKTSAARILAKCLNCEHGPAATPCNTCASCTQITQGSSLDVIEIDGASNRGIDEIRSLRETVPFAPTSGSFRIYIIDEVHMLTTEAFNALLKTLEEPPAHVKFIFATTAVAKVPSTILSRCQRFDFRRLEAATIVAALKRIAKAEKLQASEPALYAVARAADGSLRDAEVVLEQLSSFVEGAIEEGDVTTLLGAVESDTLFAWTQAILDHDAPAALSALTVQLERGREPSQLLTGLLRHLRNALIVRSAGDGSSREEVLTRLVDEPPERLKRLKEQAAQSTPQELLLLLQMLTGAYELVRRSPMAQTILEIVIIKLATREQWQSIDQISHRLEQLSVGHHPPAMGGRMVMPMPEPGTPQAAGSATGMPSTGARSNPAEIGEAGRGATPPTPTTVVSRREPETSSETTAPAAPSASEDLLAMWPTFLERLSKQKMSLFAYLAHAQPLELTEGVLTVGLPAFALHQEVLSLVDHRKLIERLLSELFRTPIRMQYATLPEGMEPAAAAIPHPDSSAPPIVQDIVNLFNATVIDQPRST